MVLEQLSFLITESACKIGFKKNGIAVPAVKLKRWVGRRGGHSESEEASAASPAPHKLGGGVFLTSLSSWPRMDMSSTAKTILWLIARVFLYYILKIPILR